MAVVVEIRKRKVKEKICKKLEELECMTEEAVSLIKSINKDPKSHIGEEDGRSGENSRTNGSDGSKTGVH